MANKNKKVQKIKIYNKNSGYMMARYLPKIGVNLLHSFRLTRFYRWTMDIKRKGG